MFSTRKCFLPVAAGAASLIVALAGCTSPAEPSAPIATDTAAVTHAQNERVPEGASWTQHYFPSSDGSDVELHADVLLPEGLEEGEQVPVILSVSAYFAHAGELIDEGYPHAGPSDRFADLFEGADLFNEGYAFVMVDLRGFGGSTGCLDFMGPGEQADVVAAIDWAAEQSWSTGDVGMYGKSYDAITGLVGNNVGGDALKAVVAQAPLWDLGRIARSQGVPRTGIVDSSRTYNEAATMAAMPDDDERYRENAAYEDTNPACTGLNSINYRDPDPAGEYWSARDLAAQAVGTDTPILFTQGFLEATAPPEDIEQFLANHEGPVRGWMGQWDHIRGNQTDADDNPLTGREGFLDEVMAFFDEYLKGETPDEPAPAFSIQDSTGAWRAQDTWPVTDRTIGLQMVGGTYVDDGKLSAEDPSRSFVHFSEPLSVDTRITGTPRVFLDSPSHGSVLVRLHDVAPDGTAIPFNEHVSTLRPGTTEFDLKAGDWTLPAGHTLAIEVGTIEQTMLGNWIVTPTWETMEVTAVRLTIPLDDPADDVPLDGESSTYLETYLGFAGEQMTIGDPTFTLPAAR